MENQPQQQPTPQPEKPKKKQGYTGMVIGIALLLFGFMWIFIVFNTYGGCDSIHRKYVVQYPDDITATQSCMDSEWTGGQPVWETIQRNDIKQLGSSIISTGEYIIEGQLEDGRAFSATVTTYHNDLTALIVILVIFFIPGILILIITLLRRSKR